VGPARGGEAGGLWQRCWGWRAERSEGEGRACRVLWVARNADSHACACSGVQLREVPKRGRAMKLTVTALALMALVGGASGA